MTGYDVYEYNSNSQINTIKSYNASSVLLNYNL